MTSDSGYPSPGDNWRGALAHFRCPSVRDERRCQLYRGHDEPHAYAWLEARPPGYSRRAGHPYPWHPHLIRWDEGAPWSEALEGVQLRWCCLFSA